MMKEDREKLERLLRDLRGARDWKCEEDATLADALIEELDRVKP